MNQNVTQNSFMKEIATEFLFPFMLAASGLGILVFWPFSY